MRFIKDITCKNSLLKCLQETDLCFIFCLVVYLHCLMFPTMLKLREIHTFTQRSGTLRLVALNYNFLEKDLVRNICAWVTSDRFSSSKVDVWWYIHHHRSEYNRALDCLEWCACTSVLCSMQHVREGCPMCFLQVLDMKQTFCYLSMCTQEV